MILGSLIMIEGYGLLGYGLGFRGKGFRVSVFLG
jgi:hypothetical protein